MSTVKTNRNAKRDKLKGKNWKRTLSKTVDIRKYTKLANYFTPLVKQAKKLYCMSTDKNQGLSKLNEIEIDQFSEIEFDKKLKLGSRKYKQQQWQEIETEEEIDIIDEVNFFSSFKK